MNFKNLFALILIVSPVIGLTANLNDTIKIKEITITETRNPINFKDLPIDYSRISNEEVRSSNQCNILPIINNISGLFSTAKGIMGYGISTNSAGAINIRGVGQTNKVLTLIDGIPNWAGIFGHSIADNWSTDNVESIEVIKGPASLYYGSNAMGGAINVITRQQEAHGVSVGLKASIGSYATQDYSLSIGYKNDRLSTFLSGTYNYTDGDRKNSQFHLYNTFLSSKYKITSTWNIGLLFDFTHFKGYNPGMEEKPIFNNWMQATRGTVGLSATNAYNRINGSINVYFNWGNHKINDGHFENQLERNYRFKSHDHISGFSFVENIKTWEGSNLTIGGDLQNWGGKAWNDSVNGNIQEIINKCVTNLGGYTTITQKIFNIFSINGGARYEYSTQFGSKWIPQTGILATIKSNTEIRFMFSEGYRAPNLRELYMYISANENLKPENMYTYELSVKQNLFKNKLKLGLALYYIDGKNMIQVQIIDKRPQNKNIGNFYNKGIDFDLCYNANSSWGFDSNYSYLYSNIKLVSAPTHKLFTRIRYKIKALNIALSNETILGLLPSETSSKKDYSLLNLNCSYIFYYKKHQITPYADLNNITNTHYSILEGFPMPGINFMAGVKCKF